MLLNRGSADEKRTSNAIVRKQDPVDWYATGVGMNDGHIKLRPSPYQPTNLFCVARL